jgi:hypothetical protein
MTGVCWRAVHVRLGPAIRTHLPARRQRRDPQWLRQPSCLTLSVMRPSRMSSNHSSGLVVTCWPDRFRWRAGQRQRRPASPQKRGRRAVGGSGAWQGSLSWQAALRDHALSASRGLKRWRAEHHALCLSHMKNCIAPGAPRMSCCRLSALTVPMGRTALLGPTGPRAVLHTWNAAFSYCCTARSKQVVQYAIPSGGRCQPALLPGCGVNRPLLKKPHALNHRVT